MRNKKTAERPVVRLLLGGGGIEANSVVQSPVGDEDAGLAYHLGATVVK